MRVLFKQPGKSPELREIADFPESDSFDADIHALMGKQPQVMQFRDDVNFYASQYVPDPAADQCPMLFVGWRSAAPHERSLTDSEVQAICERYGWTTPGARQPGLFD